MGSYDGAEVCEMVGLYLLSEIKQKFGANSFGLYRDDGLGCFENLSGPRADRIRKDLISLFKAHSLKITVEINLKCTDFLDVTFDLRKNIFYPFRKPNDEPLFINVKSNHPPTIIKQLPKMISERVSRNSSSMDMFHKAKPLYDKALRKSGFNDEIHYNKTTTAKRKNRPRNILWFNPPFSQHIKTNISAKFKALVEKHFPKQHKYNKLFNKNNLKLSFCCLPNVGQIITQHNKKVLRSDQNSSENVKQCNCRVKADCPLRGKCLSRSIIYKATVTSGQSEKIYIGCTETTFKERYANHKQSFKNATLSSSTALSKHIWSLKRTDASYTLRWDIMAKAMPYKCGTRNCDLCMTEKLEIVCADQKSLLNSRAEIISKCRHRNKYTLKCLKT